MNADGHLAVHVTLASWTFSKTFKMGNTSSTNASGVPYLLRRRVWSWSCWWKHPSGDSLQATCCNTLGWATTTLLSSRRAPGSGRTTRLGSFRCLPSQPQQWTGWCSSTCPSTWDSGSRPATSPASLHHQSLASCNAASLSSTPSHSNWTESALPAPRSYPSRSVSHLFIRLCYWQLYWLHSSRTWLARYPLLLRLAESSVLLLRVSTTSTPACSCAKGPQEPIWQPTIPQAAAAILQHAKLNYGCVIFEHHSLYCENAKQHLFLGSTFMIMIWGATVPLRMKIIFLFFEENYLQGEGVCALFAV